MEYPTNRKDAKSTGAKYYFTGQPCKRGHMSIRKTKGSCIECIKEDSPKEAKARRLLPKSDAAKAAGKRYYEKNKDMVKARAAARPAEEKRRNKAKHQKNNPEIYRLHCRLRKRRHRQATPNWLTVQHYDQIKGMYLEAVRLTKVTGDKYVVDHIVPLTSEVVCGLHVPWNLQIMTHVENSRKNNSHTV